ncbi:hypothetical protein BJ742DRAFT_774104 [Cladochytrium replicatum]|nr:hypothetical protein BJ742DRAFT_774104 [Cladochytrium replicatum]
MFLGTKLKVLALGYLIIILCDGAQAYKVFNNNVDSIKPSLPDYFYIPRGVLNIAEAKKLLNQIRGRNMNDPLDKEHSIEGQEDRAGIWDPIAEALLNRQPGDSQNGLGGAQLGLILESMFTHKMFGNKLDSRKKLTQSLHKQVMSSGGQELVDRIKSYYPGGSLPEAMEGPDADGLITNLYRALDSPNVQYPSTIEDIWLRTAGNPFTSQPAPKKWNNIKKNVAGPPGSVDSDDLFGTKSDLGAPNLDNTVRAALDQRELGTEARIIFLTNMANLIDPSSGDPEAFSDFSVSSFNDAQITEARKIIATAFREVAKSYDTKMRQRNQKLRAAYSKWLDSSGTESFKVELEPFSAAKDLRSRFEAAITQVTGAQATTLRKILKARLIKGLNRARLFKRLARSDSISDAKALSNKINEAEKALVSFDGENQPTNIEVDDLIDALDEPSKGLEDILENEALAPDEVRLLANVKKLLGGDGTESVAELYASAEKSFTRLNDLVNSGAATKDQIDGAISIADQVADKFTRYAPGGAAENKSRANFWRSMLEIIDPSSNTCSSSGKRVLNRRQKSSCRARWRFPKNGRPNVIKNEVDMLKFLKENDIDSSILPDWDGQLESVVQDGELVGAKLMAGAESLNSVRRLLTAKLIKALDTTEGAAKVTPDIISKVLSTWADEIQDTIVDLSLQDSQNRPSEKIVGLEALGANYNALVDATGIGSPIDIPDLRSLEDIAATNELKFFALAKRFLRSLSLLPKGLGGLTESGLSNSVDTDDLGISGEDYGSGFEPVAREIVNELKRRPPPSRQRMGALRTALKFLKRSLDARRADLRVKKENGMTIEVQDARAFDKVFESVTTVGDAMSDLKGADLPDVPSDDITGEVAAMEVHGVNFFDPTNTPLGEYVDPEPSLPIKGEYGAKPSFASVPSDATFTALARADSIFKAKGLRPHQIAEAWELAVQRIETLADQYLRDPNSPGDRASRAVDHIRAAHRSLQRIFSRIITNLELQAVEAGSPNDGSRAALRWMRLKQRFRSLKSLANRISTNERLLRTSSQCSGTCSDNGDLEPISEPPSKLSPTFERSTEASAFSDLKTALDEVALSPEEVGEDAAAEAAEIRDELMIGADSEGNVPSDPREDADPSENDPRAIVRDALTIDDAHQSVARRLFRLLRRAKVKAKLAGSRSFANYYAKTFFTAAGRVGNQAQLPLQLRQREPVVTAEIVADALSIVSTQMEVGNTRFGESTNGASLPQLDLTEAVTPEQLSSMGLDSVVQVAELTGETGPDRELLPNGISGVAPSADDPTVVDPSTLMQGATTTEQVYTGLAQKIRNFILKNRSKFLTKKQYQMLRVFLAALKADIDNRAAEIARKQGTNEEISRSEISGYSKRYDAYKDVAEDFKEIDSSKLIGKEPPYNPNDPGFIAELSPKVASPAKNGIASRISGAIKSVKALLRRRTIKRKLTKSGSGNTILIRRVAGEHGGALTTNVTEEL